MANETRTVAGCRGVVLRGFGSLEIEQRPEAAGKETVAIEADEVILGRITTEVRAGRLEIGVGMPWYEWPTWWIRWLFASDKRLSFRLTAATLDSVAISGAGRITAASLSADTLEAAISGAGKISLAGVRAQRLSSRVSGAGSFELAGGVERHDVSISGAGSVRASGLATKHTTASISGSGSLAASVSDALDVTISGAGSVTYSGKPRVSQRVSGAGRVRAV